MWFNIIILGTLSRIAYDIDLELLEGWNNQGNRY